MPPNCLNIPEKVYSVSCTGICSECTGVLYISKVPVGFGKGFSFGQITVIACIQVRGSGTLWSGRIML